MHVSPFFDYRLMTFLDAQRAIWAARELRQPGPLPPPVPPPYR